MNRLKKKKNIARTKKIEDYIEKSPNKNVSINFFPMPSMSSKIFSRFLNHIKGICLVPISTSSLEIPKVAEFDIWSKRHLKRSSALNSIYSNGYFRETCLKIDLHSFLSNDLYIT